MFKKFSLQEGTYRVWNRPPEFRIPWNLVSGFRIPRPYKFTKYTVNLSLFLFLFSEGSLGVSKSLNHLQDLSFAIFVLELAPEFWGRFGWSGLGQVESHLEIPSSAELDPPIPNSKRPICTFSLAEKKCETHDRVSEEIPYFFTKFLTIPLIFVLFYGVSSNSKLTGIYSIPELRWQFKKAWRKALGGEMLRDQQNLSCVGHF